MCDKTELPEEVGALGGGDKPPKEGGEIGTLGGGDKPPKEQDNK